MDTVFAGLVTLSSAYFLSVDHQNRKKFDSFKGIKKQDGYELMEGCVSSENAFDIIKHDGSIMGKAFVKEKETKVVHKHTYHTTKTVHIPESRDIFGKILPPVTLEIPVEKTDEEWKTISNEQVFSPDIVVNVQSTQNDKRKLFFPDTVTISWDKENTKIVDGTKIHERYLVNGDPKTVFGKKLTDGSFNVKYIGSDHFVLRQVRDDHFGINNWTTGLLLATCFISGGYVVDRVTGSHIVNKLKQL